MHHHGPEVVEAVRNGEMLVAVDDDHVLRGVDGAAPLTAMVRADSHTAGLRREMTRLSARIDDLHDRMVQIAEASVEVLASR
jgi:hypothetical protein